MDNLLNFVIKNPAAHIPQTKMHKNIINVFRAWTIRETI